MQETALLQQELRDLKQERDRLKTEVDSKKLIANSTFGLLGNVYCPFYSPDLMLAVTLSGQLHLLSLIDLLSQIDSVKCVSANTDGITLTMRPDALQRVREVVEEDSEKTGFTYEEVHYREIAYRDVNSYVAVTTEGKLKRKGVFAEAGVHANTNPTFQISAQAAAKYVEDRTPPEQTVRACTDLRHFVSVRNVKGGGVHHTSTEVRDDWQEVEPRLWVNPQGKKERRKSRPRPYEIGVGGEPFGRVARWYRTTRPTNPLTYVSNGNKVPDSDQAALCMDLPDQLPVDIDYDWYTERAYNLLKSAGVELSDKKD